MPKEIQSERVNVAVEKTIHSKMSKIAELLELGVREACDQAVDEWNERNAAAANRRANQLLKPAA